MRYLLGLLILLNILDGVTTQIALQSGGRERNPFLLHVAGEPLFIVLKVAGATICALILWDVYKRYPRLALVFTLCCVTVYAGIVVWNSRVFLG